MNKEINLESILDEKVVIRASTASFLIPSYIREMVLLAMAEACFKTIDLCADNAEADVDWQRDDLMELQPGEDYEVYVLKNSILDVKKLIK